MLSNFIHVLSEHRKSSGIHTYTHIRELYKPIKLYGRSLARRHSGGRCNSGKVTVATKCYTSKFRTPSYTRSLHNMRGFLQLLWYDLVHRTGKLYVTALDSRGVLHYLPMTTNFREMTLTAGLDLNYQLMRYYNTITAIGSYICVLLAVGVTNPVCFVPGVLYGRAIFARSIGASCTVQGNTVLHNLGFVVVALPSKKHKVLRGGVTCLLGSIVGVREVRDSNTRAGY